MKNGKFDTVNFLYEAKLIDRLFHNNEFEMPVRYVLGLTNDCNLRCPFCFLEKIAAEKAMSPGDWLNVVKQLPDYARVILFGGEPLYYSHFEEVYRYVADRFRCTIVTNGTLLNEDLIKLLLSKDRFNELAVSIDTVGNTNRGFSPQQWNSLVANLKLFVKNTKKHPHPPKLGVATVILDETAEGLFAMHRFVMEEIGCDYVTYCTLNGTAMQLSDRMRPFEELYMEEKPPLYEKWDIILGQLEKIRNFNDRKGYRSYFRPKIIDLSTDAPISALRIINRDGFDKDHYGPCKMPWSDCRIYGDGSVTSCLGTAFGNFKKTPDLRSILSGPTAMRFREILKKNGFFPQCIRCVFLYSKAFA